MKFLTSIVISTLLLFFAGGCVSYQLGRPEWDGDSQTRKRVWIAPVVMEEVVADVAIPLNRELREQVIRNRSLRLVEDRALSDVQLIVTVTSRTRESLARRSDDTGLSDVLRFDLAASYQLTSSSSEETKTGELLIEGQVFRNAGFNESTRQRLPSMLKDLADDILQDAFMGW